MQLDHHHPTIAALLDHQQRLGLSDAAFSRRWLDCAASTWGRVQSGAYAVADQTQILARFEGALAALEDHAAAGTGAAAAGILPLTSVRAVQAAIRAAATEPRDRLVVVLAPTGGGKTSLARAIGEAYHGRAALVEATEPWRKSYLAACEAIAIACGLRDIPSSARAAEATLLAYLEKTPRIILIDEAHYLGPQTANAVKAILNKTSSTIVLLAIPALWSRTRRTAWEEAEQLRSRTCALLQLDAVPRADVDALLADRLPPAAWADHPTLPDRARILQAITDAANRFGLLDTVERIARELRHQLGDHPIPLTPDLTTAALAHVSTLRS
jgi:DNA transposition AAA+ family ATPase